LIHFDCYRLGLDLNNRSEGLILPEIDEWIEEAIIVVEWAQYLHPSYFSLPTLIWIRFEILSTQKRIIKIKTLLKGFEIK
jgi:tRNA A37 threonylcarbamoyladenosine biosynthesis protein TsaE